MRGDFRSIPHAYSLALTFPYTSLAIRQKRTNILERFMTLQLMLALHILLLEKLGTPGDKYTNVHSSITQTPKCENILSVHQPQNGQ